MTREFSDAGAGSQYTTTVLSGVVGGRPCRLAAEMLRVITSISVRAWLDQCGTEDPRLIVGPA